LHLFDARALSEKTTSFYCAMLYAECGIAMASCPYICLSVWLSIASKMYDLE